MLTLQRFLITTFGFSVLIGIRYLVFAGVAWLLGYLFFRARWWHRKIIQRAPLPAEVRREIAYSLLTLLIFGAVGAATAMARKAGYTQMYFRIERYGWPWFFASIGLTILLHDTYFYWTHRLMHHRRLFRFFHRAHHLSTNPTPWASYAFDPLEAVVQAGIFPLSVVVMPLHPIAFLVFMIWQITFNVAGHTGYEYHPRWFVDSWLGKVLNTPTNHIMHHEHFRGNYGLYFNVWDRLMGTNHERYAARFREVTSRPRPVAASAAPPAAADLTRA